MFAEDKLEMRITIFNQQYHMLYSNMDNTETKYLTIKITRMVSYDYKLFFTMNPRIVNLK